jgi:hypothetical protein
MVTRKSQAKALARFRKIEKGLPALLVALVSARPYIRGTPPAVPAIAGVYLFSECGRPQYLGRTRNANRRLGEHTQPKAPQNKAPFAFNVAKAEALAAGLEIVGGRDQIEALPGFEPHFSAAKAKVRAMEFRVVEVTDPAVSTIFEVYASIALGTEGEYNLFETH